MSISVKIKQNFWDEHRDEVLQKFCQFTIAADDQLQKMHVDNLQYINSNLRTTSWEYVEITSDHVEQTSIKDLLRTCGNTQINRVLNALAIISTEFKRMASEVYKDILKPLSLYYSCDLPENFLTSEINSQNSEFDESSTFNYEAVNKFQKLLPVLIRIRTFSKNCENLVTNTLHQLHTLTLSGITPVGREQVHVDLADARFDCILQDIQNLLTALVTLDECLSSKDFLRDHLNEYKKLLQLFTMDASLTQEQQIQLRFMLSLLEETEKNIYANDTYLGRLIHALRNSFHSNVAFTKNNCLADQFVHCIRTTICDLERHPLKMDEMWIKAYTLFILYAHLFAREDKKLFRFLLETQKRFAITSVHLQVNISIYPESLLSSYLRRSLADRKCFEYFHPQRDFASKQSLTERLESLQSQIMQWHLKVADLRKQVSSIDLESLPSQIRLLEDGAKLAQSCIQIAKTHIHLHLRQGKPMSQSNSIAICKLVALSKYIHVFFTTHRRTVTELLDRYVSFMAYSMLKFLGNIRAKLMIDTRKYSAKRLDVISSLILACNLLNGPCMTFERHTLLLLNGSIISQMLSDEEIVEFQRYFERLGTISSLDRTVATLSDCSFLYSHTSLLNLYFKYSFDHELDSLDELRYVLIALHDSAIAFNTFPDALDSFEKGIITLFQQTYLKRLCEQFENELRLKIHDELHEKDLDPFKRPVCNFSLIFREPPLRILSYVISLREYVQEHLNEVAYKLTAIALHDWSTYEKMLCSASAQYGFTFVRSQLPAQTLGQGMDVLWIARNIDQFASQYYYNLNNQFFVQEPSLAHYQLNVLLPQHVCNSLRTHGLGILHTAVNHTYRFIKQQLSTISRFLHEPHIRARLQIELRESTGDENNLYSYSRAERLLKDIQALGLVRDKRTFLDELRIVISQLGNALGFVRSLRTGVLNYGEDVVSRVPDINARFTSGCKEEKYGEQTEIAAEKLDQVLIHAQKCLSDASEYLPLLVRVFKDLLQQQKDDSLQNLYTLLPTLTLSYVQHMLLCKEKLQRKTLDGATFTDDGFVIGIAYLLTLFKQWNKLFSLHWFTSVQEHVRNKLAELAKRPNTGNRMDDAKISQASVLSCKQLNALGNEFELLRYNLTSCQVLFLSSKPDNE